MLQLKAELDRLVSATDGVQREVIRLRERLAGGARRRAAASEADLERIEEQVIYLRLVLDTVRQTSRKLRAAKARPSATSGAVSAGAARAA